MTVQEAMQAKAKAESEIFDALRKFTEATGLSVANVSVESLEFCHIGHNPAARMVTSVSLDVRL